MAVVLAAVATEMVVAAAISFSKRLTLTMTETDRSKANKPHL